MKKYQVIDKYLSCPMSCRSKQIPTWQQAKRYSLPLAHSSQASGSPRFSLTIMVLKVFMWFKVSRDYEPFKMYNLQHIKLLEKTSQNDSISGKQKLPLAYCRKPSQSFLTYQNHCKANSIVIQFVSQNETSNFVQIFKKLQ